MNKTILTTLLLTVPILAGAQQPEPFKKGDRVAFVGNSITDGGHYHSYIWLYYMTRFPDRKISIYNCGIGGDTGLGIQRCNAKRGNFPKYRDLQFLK